MSFITFIRSSRSCRLAAVLTGLWLTASAIAPPALAKSDAPASPASGSIHVSATVAAYATLESKSHAPALWITAKDIERGFIEVSDALSASVRTNSPDGYSLRLTWLGKTFGRGRVLADGVDTELTRDGAVLDRPTKGFTRETLNLDVRIELEPSTEPGVYAWPLAIEPALKVTR